MNFLKFVLISSFLPLFLFAQPQEKLFIVGDKLIGKTINGESYREVIGNVVLTQGKVKITCRKAIQNLSRNEAELIGDVVALQDSIEIYTQRGYYFGEKQYSYSDTAITLFDGHATLTADRGYYYYESERAEFFSNVKLVDSNSVLTSEKLIYFNKFDKAIATKDVKIINDQSSIWADSLIHLRNERKTTAFKNIILTNNQNNTLLFGQQLYDDAARNYSRIEGDPLLMKIDTSESGKVDTLLIKSRTMESVKDSSSTLIAKDSVRIMRGNFLSVNDYSILYQDRDLIFTYKLSDETNPPVMWYDYSQLVGDSIYIYMRENELDYIDIKQNSFILSSNEKFTNKYDQISGNFIKMNFAERELKSTFVEGNVLSIYYLYEETEPNGLLKSSSERAKIFFDSSRVTDVKLYGSIKSEYHPENLIAGKELEFTLPTFKLFYNKPKKNELIETYNQITQKRKWTKN